MFAVTVTVRFPSVVAVPSETRRTTVFAPVAAEQLAATFAVIFPFELLIEVTEMPVGTVTAVTVKLPAAVSASLTTAIWELLAAEPCCRVMPPEVGVIDGGVFEAVVVTLFGFPVAVFVL